METEHNQITLRRIEIRQVAMTPRRALAAAHGTVGERKIIVARVWDDNGVHGWGECVAFPNPGYLNETTDTAWSALQGGIIPAVHKRPFDSPDALAKYLAGAMPQSPVAAATIEMASWDLMARRQDRSLANVLGGVRSNIAAGRTIGFLESPGDLINEVDNARREGYQRIKVKIEPQRALTVAMQAVKAAGEVPVTADANASFSPQDLQKLRELDATDLSWIEQPFPPASLRATADLRDSLATPIALDESAGSINAIERIVAMEAARALSIKPGRLGGIAAALRAYRAAKAASMSLWIGGMLETGIGRAHNLALAALPGFDLPGDMGPSSDYWERDLITEPFEMVAGHIAVPAGPGIGVTVDTDYLNAATVARAIAG
jgi:O-succinylbenzoate synthase